MRRRTAKKAAVVNVGEQKVKEAEEKLKQMLEQRRKEGNVSVFTTENAVIFFLNQGLSLEEARKAAAEFEKKHFNLMLCAGEYAKYVMEKAKKLPEFQPNPEELKKRHEERKNAPERKSSIQRKLIAEMSWVEKLEKEAVKLLGKEKMSRKDEQKLRKIIKKINEKKKRIEELRKMEEKQ